MDGEHCNICVDSETGKRDAVHLPKNQLERVRNDLEVVYGVLAAAGNKRPLSKVELDAAGSAVGDLRIVSRRVGVILNRVDVVDVWRRYQGEEAKGGEE